MALMKAIVIIAMIFAAPALATEYTVGGKDAGWNRGVNFTTWAHKYDFHVGDSLMFMYTPNSHNVIKVNATEFKSCTYSNDLSKIYTSGMDVIPLSTPGKKWYISGVAGDCDAGMKLVITVSADGPIPSPVPGSPTPPPGTSAAGGALKSCVVWMVAVMVAYMIMA